jgi:hypothetical protein
VARKPGIPSYRLHKATGQAVVTIAGRDHYLGSHGSPESTATYQAMVRKTTADRLKAEQAQQVGYATDVTVAELVVK